MRGYRRRRERVRHVEDLELGAHVLLAQRHVRVILLDPRPELALWRLRDGGLVHQRALDLLRAGRQDAVPAAEVAEPLEH